MKCCHKGHELKPIEVNGYPSRNIHGKVILFCGPCGVFHDEPTSQPEPEIVVKPEANAKPKRGKKNEKRKSEGLF